MLRAEIYVNHEKIDEVQILNTGKKFGKESEYKVVSQPIPFYVYHERKNGWEQLLLKVLSKIEILRN